MSGLLGMTHHDLMTLRNQSPPEMQKELAPYEHRAFAREMVADSPVNALGLLLGIPAYQVAKLLGIQSARTAPSLEQLKQGYIGTMEGLRTGLLGNSTVSRR